MSLNVADYKNHLVDLFETCVIRPERKDDVKWYADKCLARKQSYEAVAIPLDIPWYVIAIIHAMEASFSWYKWLANGNPLTGPCTDVPIGLGKGESFPISWERAATLSAQYDGLDKITDWSLGNLLYRVMCFNGTGYIAKGIETPYLWSFSNHYTKGKYVKDGPDGWDANAISEQCGAALVLKELEARGAIAIPRAPGASVPAPASREVGWHKLQLIVKGTGGNPAELPQIEVGFIGKIQGTNDDKIRSQVSLPVEFVRAWFSQFPNARDIRFAGEGEPWLGDLKPDTPPPATPASGAKKYLKCQRTGTTDDDDDLEILLLTMEGSSESWYVRSGARGRQVFQKGGTGEIPGTLYPAPQGEYSVKNIQWAAGKDNYDASLGAGLGPLFVPFEPCFSTARSAFGFHIDQNHDTSPGSAGCIVFLSLADLKSFVAALRKYDPTRFVIDWGL
jgi:lysozyme family protein